MENKYYYNRFKVINKIKGYMKEDNKIVDKKKLLTLLEMEQFRLDGNIENIHYNRLRKFVKESYIIDHTIHINSFDIIINSLNNRLEENKIAYDENEKYHLNNCITLLKMAKKEYYEFIHNGE